MKILSLITVKCNNRIEKVLGEFIFCSRKCSNIYSSNINKSNKNKNISKGMKAFYCDKPTQKKKRKEFLEKLENDPEFAQKYNEELHRKRSIAGKKAYQKAVESNKFMGWQVRNKPSYAELFWQDVLDKNNIIYQKEYKILKKDLNSNLNGCYFLDFYINVNGFKIDLEIDGKQHNYSERKELDKIRDNLLKKNNYIVYRIPWINPKNTKNKKVVKEQIKNLINFILIHYI